MSGRAGLIGICTAADERDMMHLDQVKGNVTAFADLARASGAETEYLAHFDLRDVNADKERLEELIWLKKQGRYAAIVVFASGSDGSVKSFRLLFNPYDISADDVTVVFSTANSPKQIMDNVWRPDLLALTDSCVSPQDRGTLMDRNLQPIYHASIPHNLTDRRLEAEAEKARSELGYVPQVSASTVVVVVNGCAEAKRIAPNFIVKAARISEPLDVVVMAEMSRFASTDEVITAETDQLSKYVNAIGGHNGVGAASGFLCTDKDNRLPALLHRIKTSGVSATIVISGLLETAAAILSSHCANVTVTMHPAMNTFERGVMTALWRGGWIDVQDENGKITPRATPWPGAKNNASAKIAKATLHKLGLRSSAA